MKKIKSTLALCALLAMLAAPVAAFNDEVTVQFRTQVSPQFVQTLNQTFKTQAVQIDKQTWRFKVPKLRTQEQFSELFASMPGVASTDPMPVYNVADHINPQAVHVQPVPDQQYQRSSQNYLPGEMLVKFKAGTTAEDMRFLNNHHQIVEMGRISGIDVYRLRLPQGLSVEEAMEIYNQSGIVEYAEPNYRVQIQPSPQPGASVSPQPSASPNQSGIPQGTAVYTQIPLDGGGQMLVTFRPGTSKEAVALFYQLYGTRQVRQESFVQYRIQLPPGLNPNRALRIFMLFPHINNVQRLYS